MTREAFPRATLLGSVALVALMAAAGSAYAEDDASVEELRELIELQQRQIEMQNRTLERMSERLEQVEQEAGGLVVPPSVSEGGDITLPPPQPRNAELERLQAKVERLERAQASGASTVAPAQAVTAGDRPGTFKLPGTNTSVEISGYAKGDFIYDIDADTGDSFAASAIPPDGSPEDNGPSTRLHGRQTRITVATYTPSSFGEVKTFVQGDFFGTGGNERFSNSTSFRLRHAYGSLGPLLVGQTWTLFMPLASYPATVDFFGPAGIPFVRQGQVRYTQAVGDNLTIAASLENPETTARQLEADGSVSSIGENNSDLNVAIDRAPDVVAAIDYETEGGFNWRVAGVGRLLGLDDEGFDDEAFGWGVFTGGVIPVLGETPFGTGTNLVANFAYGDGIGRYIINSNFAGAIVEDGELETVTSWGFAGSINHNWSEKWSSNLVYGHYEVEDTLLPDDTEALDTFHINLFWSPVERVSLGIEYIYGLRSFADSDLDNDAQRVQFGAQFFF